MSERGRKRVVIFGAGTVGQVVYRHLRHGADYEVAGFTVDRVYLPAAETLNGLPIVDFASVEQRFPPGEFELIVALGYQQLNDIRRRTYEAAKAKGYRLASLVSAGARFGDWLDVGDNCLILDNVTVEPGAKIGNDVVVWSGALIGHDAVVEDHCWITGQAVIGGGARIGERSFLGLGAIVGNGVVIGAESFLGAGVLLTKCAPAKSVFIARDTERFRLDSERFWKISKLR